MNTLNLHGVRMWVTEGCNASCHFCLNANDRTNSYMEVDKFSLLCNYFYRHGFDKIVIMGGEPTIHPDFISIMETAQSCFSQVYLFTNALNSKKLIQFVPRENDVIVYNANFAKDLTKEKLLPSKPGKRVLDVVVNTQTKIDILEKEVFQIIHNFGKRINVQLVIDNRCNIFTEKYTLVQYINRLYKHLSAVEDADVHFECNAPICFTAGADLPMFKQNTICTPTSVLIDGSYNVRFCNIYSHPLINMFKDGQLIPFRILENYVKLAHKQLQMECLSKICRDCLYYDRLCNGKCYIGQDIITREDIEKNTNIPWLKNNVNGTR